MAELIGVVALSHSPFWRISAPEDGPGTVFKNAVARVRAAVRERRPDALVVFGPDHFRNFFYDVMPPFCIGAERIRGFGDFGTPRGALPAATGLARMICTAVMEAGFDPALSLDMGMDHGITQAYAALVPACDIPMVPVMINAASAPRPGLRRCYEFGRAVGAAIRNSTGRERALVVGSGGLSHWPKSMSVEDPTLTPDMRDYLIAGRPRAGENSAARDASLLERQGKVQGRVNPEWDRQFLAAVAAHELEPIFRQTPAEVERDGGPGGHEVRAWLAALGAWGRPAPTIAYEPLPEWITGMGCVAAF